jgi:hypothetical protein
VVGSFDPEELLRLWGFFEYSLHNIAWAVLIVIAADEELGLRAVRKEAVGVVAACRADGDTETDEPFDAWISAAGAEPYVGAEREAGEEDGQVQVLLEPVEGGFDVVLFASALIVRAFAEAGAAKVEAKDGKAEGREGLHGVIDDLVVHGAAAGRVRVADEGGVRCVVAAGVEKGFEVARRAAKIVDGSDL